MTHGSKSESQSVVNVGSTSLSKLVGSGGTINTSDNGDRFIILNLDRGGLSRNRLGEEKRKGEGEHNEEDTDIAEGIETLYSTSIDP